MPRYLLNRKMILVNGYLFFCFVMISVSIFSPLLVGDFYMWAGICLIIVGVSQFLKFRYAIFLTKWSKQILQYKKDQLGVKEWKKWDRHLLSIAGWFLLGACYLGSSWLMEGFPYEDIPFSLFTLMSLCIILLINVHLVIDNRRLKNVILNQQS